ncbi:MAG: hypothetical protein IJ251_04740 [Oscillospiraceae bacterium]|nr:hypothetical protein [Oscillospiraceae bacterium]
MKTLKLELDFMNGPVWKGHYDIESGNMDTGLPVVDSDVIVQELNEHIQNSYNSCYDFPPNGGSVFNEQKWNELRPDLIPSFSELLKRLDVINDGTFELEDNLSGTFLNS